MCAAFIKDQWTATQPVLYNIFGELTWVVPVLDGNGLFRELAVVNANDSTKIAHNANREIAYNDYKRLLTEKDGKYVPTSASDVKKLSGKIVGIFKETKDNAIQVSILLDASEKIFILNETVYPYAKFLEKGDKVSLEYIETGELVSPVTKLSSDLK